MLPQVPPSAEPVSGPWGICEVLLVADRTRGGTHRVYQDWRVEAVMCSGRPGADTALFAVPVALREPAAAGWRYDLRLEGARPDPAAGGRSVFSWRATTAPGTPDPLAAAMGRVGAWLTAHDWEPDPLHPTRYHG